MTQEATVSEKLKKNVARVDEFIIELLEPVWPDVLYQAASHIITAGGKRLRPYLVTKSCELVGGERDSALPFAAAMEVLHNFTLIHDDIMDNDELRRGVSTVHKRWGVPIAIASGDLLFAKVYQAMIEPAVEGSLACSRAIDCIKRVTDATITICEGQALDISYMSVRDISEGNYISMVGGKTSALFRACAEVGAIVGGGSHDEVELLGSYAWNAGIAFQIVDDVLGLISDEEILGKPIGSDLREGKKTLMVIHALEHASPARREVLEKVLGSMDATASDIEAAKEALRDTGSIDYAMSTALEYAKKAEASLESFPESQAKRDLLELVEFFVKRTH
jgi:geranylgeranyl diphosphate synthase type I